MSVRPTRSARRAAAATLVVACLGLTACDAGSALPGSSPDPESPGSSETGSGSASADPAAAAQVKTNVGKGAADVPVDTLVEVTAANASLTAVDVTSEAGSLAGELAEDGSAWAATDRLEPGTTYAVKATAEGSDGRTVRRTSSFTTQDLTLDEQTYPSVAPLDGETVGVGMPVIVNFDVPVTDKASIERSMSVTSTPAQPGTWHWMSDNEAHWRPKTYWKSGTQVDVDVDINGVPAGNGIYGQEDRAISFDVGDANIYRVDMETYQMKVVSNGELLRTIPITTGEQPEFTTRSGIKVIVEMFDSKRMNSETIGIPQGAPGAYDIDNVQYAMRVTYSGEFIHAAPWSVGSQGYANVSHGCTGMSTDNAAWLYGISKRGDVVEYTGTDRGMEPGNGYADWNTSYADYRKGSALS